MKIGFCMLLWTTNVTGKHKALLEDIKATGYDGVEIPIFEGAPDDYKRLGEMLDRIGLERTAVTAMGDPGMNLISPDAAARRKGIAYMKWAIDCAAALGTVRLSGPTHSTLGAFTGVGPTPAEKGKVAISPQAASPAPARTAATPRRSCRSERMRHPEIRTAYSAAGTAVSSADWFRNRDVAQERPGVASA